MNRQELVKEIFGKKSFLCVGLDTDINKIPDFMKGDKDAIFEFNKAIIDATAPYCVAYKPNLAFYECCGLDGMNALEKTINYLHGAYPKHFIIADAKRGDIGNTSAMYAKSFFETSMSMPSPWLPTWARTASPRSLNTKTSGRSSWH